MQNCRAELALSASRMGALPANSFVSASHALALQSSREHRDPIKVGRLLAESQQIPLLFTGKSLRNWAEHVDHETLLAYSRIRHWNGLFHSVCSRDKIDLQPNATVLSILQSSTGKTVELRLQAGEKMGGKVEQVTDNVVHLSHLTGAEFFDGFVNVKDISAVVIRTGGK